MKQLIIITLLLFIISCKKEETTMHTIEAYTDGAGPILSVEFKQVSSPVQVGQGKYVTYEVYPYFNRSGNMTMTLKCDGNIVGYYQGKAHTILKYTTK